MYIRIYIAELQNKTIFYMFNKKNSVYNMQHTPHLNYIGVYICLHL